MLVAGTWSLYNGQAVFFKDMEKGEVEERKLCSPSSF